jgi:hypothetical protein
LGVARCKVRTEAVGWPLLHTWHEYASFYQAKSLVAAWLLSLSVNSRSRIDAKSRKIGFQQEKSENYLTIVGLDVDGFSCYQLFAASAPMDKDKPIQLLLRCQKKLYVLSE